MMCFSFDIGKRPSPTSKCKVATESSPYLLVWMHFDHMLSYVSIFPYLFVMFILPSYATMVGSLSPYPFGLMYSVVVLYCVAVWVFLSTNMFGRVIFSACLGVNMRMRPMVPVR